MDWYDLILPNWVGIVTAIVIICVGIIMLIAGVILERENEPWQADFVGVLLGGGICITPIAIVILILSVIAEGG